MQPISTDEENYELTQSHLESQSQEQTCLLKDDSSSEDEEWAIVDDQQPEMKPDNPLLRYICLGFAIGVSFLVARVLLVYIAHDYPTKRPAEKLYSNGTQDFASTVVLVSLDGFRPDYLERNITPHLNALANDGIRAKYLHPSFPPSTFPNHWTLITGLYPEAHGIVRNEFYDPDLDMFFEHANATITKDHRWWKGEPLWYTSRKNRQKTASIMWPGSNTRYNTPDYVVPFNNSVTMQEKMQTTLNWLDLSYDERPQMISIYVQQVDQEGHRGGPNGPKMNNYIQQVDDAVGYLTRGLEERSIDSHVHVVIVSDHGMASTDRGKLIYYDDILPSNLLKYIQNTSPTSILHFPHDMPEDVIQEMYQHLSNYTQSHHFKVYLQQNMPDRYHYKDSNRIFPIQVIPNTGYLFASHKMAAKDGGDHHGYDNLADDMRAIFLAKGPKVNKMYREGSILAPLFNIELYGFLAELLNIDAAPNNGTMRNDFPVIYQPPF